MFSSGSLPLLEWGSTITRNQLNFAQLNLVEHSPWERDVVKLTMNNGVIGSIPIPHTYTGIVQFGRTNRLGRECHRGSSPLESTIKTFATEFE